MATSLWYRLGRVGAFTAEQRTVIQSDEVIFAEPGLRSVSRGRNIRMPGIRIGGGRSVRLHSGALVLTPARILLGLGRFTLIDARLGEAAQDAPASVHIDAEGVHAIFDVAAVTGSGTGTVTLECAVPIAPDALDRLAARSAAIRPDRYAAQTVIRRLV